MYFFTVLGSCKLKMTLLQVHCLWSPASSGEGCCVPYGEGSGRMLQGAAFVKASITFTKLYSLSAQALKTGILSTSEFLKGVHSNHNTLKKNLSDRSEFDCHTPSFSHLAFELSCQAINPAVAEGRGASQVSDREPYCDNRHYKFTEGSH